ncbi:MAG: permease [Candidatus Altiarchaeota archaeon]
MEDRTDPICGMKGHIPAHGKWFCSEHCVKKFEQTHNLEPEEPCPQCAVPTTKWYKEKLYIASILFILLVIVSAYIPALSDFHEALIDYISIIWWAILLGLIIGGIIDHYIPRTYISKFLTKPEKKTILHAVGFGFLMSACSHGILAIAIELHKKGASTPAVIAFLLASPWANLPITILLFGFFGMKAFFLVVSAIVVAIITGLAYQVLDERKMIEPVEKHDVEEGFSIRKDIKERWQGYRFTRANIHKDIHGVLAGGWALSKMVVWWLIIGVIFAAGARAFVPSDFFHDYMGPTIIGLVVTLVLATVIEVCSEGSAPLAFEIFNQTGAFGNTFIFLMAGVATDYTEIGLLWANIGKKTALWLPIITVPQILVLGVLFNLLL